MNKTVVKTILALLAIIVLSFLAGYGVAIKSQHTWQRVVRDTTTYVDTIAYYQPVAKDSAVVKYITQVLPVVHRDTITTYKTNTFIAENSRTAVSLLHSAKSEQVPFCTHLQGNVAQKNGENIPPQEMSDERDSIAVEIPITQKRYDGENYKAYVSGYKPNLDSIFVFPKTTVVRENVSKPPNKWHVGITGGYGYGLNSKQAEPYIGIGITYSILSF